MATTIRDVAERAGVSVATVSYVLNNRSGAVRISDRTRERILRAVQELEYHPNALASSLAGKRTRTIALVMQYASIFSGWSGFTSSMMHGVIEAAISHDLDLMLHTRVMPDLRTEALALTDGRVDGALLLRDWDDPLIDLLAEKGLPTVLIFSRSRNATVPYSCCDDELGGRMAAEYLIGLGHRRILHVTGGPHSSAVLDRLRGFTAAHEDAGIPLDPALVLELPYGNDDAPVIAEALLHEPRATAVFAWSDDAALRVMAVARTLGIEVPRDLSVMGFDSTEVCEHTSPTLTSIAQNIPTIAHEGVRKLCALIEGNTSEVRSTVVAPELCVRGSVAPAPPPSEGGAK